MAEFWRKRAGLLGFCLAISTALAGAPARAELTVEALTGNAVTGVGPFFQDVADAIKEFGNGEYDAAAAHLENAKRLTPKLAPADVMMAQLYLDAKNPLAANAMLERAIQRSPQDPEPYVILAERAAGEMRATEASLMFQQAAKAIENFNDNPKRKQNLQLRTFTGWAAVDEARANWKEAKAKLEQLVKLDPTNAMAHDRLARVLYRGGNQEAAWAEFKLAAEASKTLPPAELAMAALATDKVKAEKWLKLALDKHGDDLRTRIGAAHYLMVANQPEEAKQHAEEALKIDPDGLESNLSMGLVARMLADYPTAEKHLAKAHLLEPNNPSTINNLALVLLELPDETSKTRAFQFAELNARQFPNNPEVQATLGWVCYRLNRRKEAERAFNAALSMSDPVGGGQRITPDLAYYLANLAKEQGKYPKAIQLLRDSLNNDQPFAYRKPATELLAQVSKLEKARAPAAKGKAQPTAKSSETTAKKSEAAK